MKPSVSEWEHGSRGCASCVSSAKLDDGISAPRLICGRFSDISCCFARDGQGACAPDGKFYRNKSGVPI